MADVLSSVKTVLGTGKSRSTPARIARSSPRSKVSRSIYSRILSAFLLVAGGTMVIQWAVPAVLPDNYGLIAAVALSLALACISATVLARSFSSRLETLRAITEALGKAEMPAIIPDLGDDEIGAFAKSLREMSAALRRSAQGLAAAFAQREAILEGMIEGLLVVDHDMKVSFCNSAFARAIAGGGATRPGAPVLSVVRDPMLIDLIKAVIQSGEEATARLQMSAAPGRSFQVRAAPLAAFAATGAVVLLLDITEMERLERVRKDFVANVSHEFRTPLAAIRGYAETLLDQGLEDVDNRRQFVEIILASANRLNNIASDLLALSDLESGTPPPALILSLEESVDAALQIVQAEAGIRGVSLVRGNVPGDLRVRGNKTRLEQALINLLDNAIKFNRAGGTVRVDAKFAEGGCAQVTIEDSGIGIPSDQLSRIFERFYRVDKGRSRAVGGTGLGLSIVKHAIEQMNGTVAVESTLGRGSRFTITLPVAGAESR